MLSREMALCCLVSYLHVSKLHMTHLYYIVSSAVSMLKRPTITDYQSAESEQLMKRLRPGGHGVDEVILHFALRKHDFFILYKF
jgi:hypothetical protein